MADQADPFAAAGFVPQQSTVPSQGAVDPFAAAGFAPAAAPAPVPTATPQPKISTVVGTGPSGEPVFSDPADNAKYQEGQNRTFEKFGEGATFGMFPYIAAGAKWLGGTPFQQGLSEARGYTADTSKMMPAASTIAEGAGSVLPTAITLGAVNPAMTAVSKAIPYIGSPLAQAILGGGLGAASTAGHDVGSGQTTNLGADVLGGAGTGAAIGAAAPLVGTALQMAPNIAQGAVSAVKNAFTGPGKDAMAGQILREAAGDFQGGMARSPLPDLALRTAQATGNPGLATLERTIGSEGATLPGDVVQGGRTPNQMGTLARALVGSDAGIEPQVLVNQAGARGTAAVTGLDNALSGVERGLWNTPELSGVKLDAPSLAAGVRQDVAAFPASWRDAVMGPQNKLGAYLSELKELGPNASIPDVNSVRSRLLGVARDAASGPNPDSATAAAANRMAGSIIDRMGADPAIAGAPATSVLPHFPDPGWVRAAAQGIPVTTDAIPANPGAWNAYQAARDFSRQYHTTMGYPEFDAILNPNASGNVQGNPERMFGRFFDVSGGTNVGLQRLQAAADLAHSSGAGSAAGELQNAAQQYARAAILKQARAGAGLDATNAPVTNPATLATTVNKTVPALGSVRMTEPIAGDVQAAGNAAELLNRPSATRGDLNSTTFEKLRSHDLMSAILGQAGSSSLGAAAGGYAAGRYGPEEVPMYARVPLGMLAGAMLGQHAGPFIGRTMAHIPGASMAITGPTSDIMRRVAAGLASPEEYQRLIAARMIMPPALTAPGAVSTAAPLAAQAAIPMVTGGAR